MKLEAFGVEVYCPVMTKVTKRADCEGVRRSVKQLFPGYMFLRFDPEVVHTTTIGDLPGVKGFVRFGGEICNVSESVIEALKQSLLIRTDQKITKLEFRNVPTEIMSAISYITELKSEVERQSALFQILQQETQLMKLSERKYSRIVTSTENAC
jgi:transcriptional antiterminator RfaH